MSMNSSRIKPRINHNRRRSIKTWKLRATTLVDFDKILTDVREQFRQHHELFKKQALLTKMLLQNLPHNGSHHGSHNGSHNGADAASAFEKSASSTQNGDVSKASAQPAQTYNGTICSICLNTLCSCETKSIAEVPKSWADEVYHLPPTPFPAALQTKGTMQSRGSTETAATACASKSTLMNQMSSEMQVLRDNEKQRKSKAGLEIFESHGEIEASMRRSIFPQNNTSSSAYFDDLATPEYNVEDYYYDTGILQAIARSDMFGQITLCIIMMNAIYIGVDVDHNTAETISDASVGFQICEYLFFCFFSCEWLLRFFAFRSKIDGLRDPWFRFDTALVVMMVVENTFLPIVMDGVGIPIPTSMIKLIRLLRLARMARLMRSLPELCAMIKGLRMAFRAVGSALLLLLLLVYIFAITIFLLLRDQLDVLVDTKGLYYAKTYFGTLSTTMWTLLVDGAFMDSYGSLSRKLLHSGQWIAFFSLLVFVLASALTVINMLIGVLCEVVTGVAAAEKNQFEIGLVKETLLLMLLALDTSQDGTISRDEMDHVLDAQTTLKVLRSLKVKPADLMDHIEMFFEEAEDGDVPIAEVLELILTLRGDRVVTMSDLLYAQNFQWWKVTKYFHALDTEMLRRIEAVQSGVLQLLQFQIPGIQVDGLGQKEESEQAVPMTEENGTVPSREDTCEASPRCN